MANALMCMGFTIIFGPSLNCSCFVSCNLGIKWPKCGMKIVVDCGGCSKWLSSVLALAHDRDGWVLLHVRHFCAYTQRKLQQFHKIVIITFVLGLLTGLYKERGMYHIQSSLCTMPKYLEGMCAVLNRIVNHKFPNHWTFKPYADVLHAFDELLWGWTVTYMPMLT